MSTPSTRSILRVSSTSSLVCDSNYNKSVRFEDDVPYYESSGDDTGDCRECVKKSHKVEELKARNNMLDDEVRELKKDVRHHIQPLQEQICTLKAENDELESALYHLTGDKVVKDRQRIHEENKKLKQHNKEKTELITSFEKRLKQMKTDTTVYRMKLRNASVEELMDEASSSKRRIDELEAQVASLQTHLEHAETYKPQLRRAEQKLDAICEKNMGFLDDNKKASAQVESLGTSVERLRDDLEGTRQQLGSESLARRCADDELAQLRRELEDRDNKLLLARAEIRLMQKRADERPPNAHERLTHTNLRGGECDKRGCGATTPPSRHRSTSRSGARGRSTSRSQSLERRGSLRRGMTPSEGTVATPETVVINSVQSSPPPNTLLSAAVNGVKPDLWAKKATLPFEEYARYHSTGDVRPRYLLGKNKAKSNSGTHGRPRPMQRTASYTSQRSRGSSVSKRLRDVSPPHGVSFNGLY